MKTITLLIVMAMASAGCSQQNKAFDKRLNSDEAALCQSFKEKAGQDRYTEMQKILELFPEFSREISKPGKIDSREHLDYFLGKPDEIRDNGAYVYTLNGPDKRPCTVAIFFDEKGLISFMGFENCKDF